MSQLSLQKSVDLRWACAAWRAALSLCVLLLMLVCARAQGADGLLPDDRAPLVVEGVNTSDVFGWGQSVVVRGQVKQGVMAFGGDVVVEGVVEGDVATVGGSVVQRDGARIGGDVIVIGGAYRHGRDASAGRDPARTTVMFAGFEQELRNIMRNPASLLTPQWSVAYLGSRVLGVLFWFIASLVLTAVSPGAVSRAVTRLQLTNLRVAVIGFVGSILMTFGVVAWLSVLPTVIGALVGLAALLLIFLAYLFGRVAIQAATGQWLQRKFFPEKYRSESVALLLGTIFWATLLSLPYVWPLVGAGLLVASVGLALTARYRVGWKRP
ncbi:MAG TPA: hypothetical protein VN256_19565 [Pyrinomonadaceae bacterium]|nr:hypothetical protein [Pyrinomonadaceae bacterium]